MAEARVLLDRTYSLDSYFLETVISSAFLLNPSNEEIHELATSIEPPEKPLDPEQQELYWVKKIAIQVFRNKLQRSENHESILKYIYDEEFQQEANPMKEFEYKTRTVHFMPTFQGEWFEEFLIENKNKKPSFNEFPLEWVERCHKIVNGELGIISMMKKATLDDLGELMKMHKLIQSYFSSLTHFNELLKNELIRRTIKIEDKECIELGDISEDVFKAESVNTLVQKDLPEPSSNMKTHIEKQTPIMKPSPIEKPKMEEKSHPENPKPIEPIQQDVPTAVEIEMMKLRELPSEAVVWFRLNPMLAKKAMCHLNPDIGTCFVGCNIIDLGWVRNPKDARFLEKPIEDRIVTIDKRPCAVMDIIKIFTIELFDPVSLEIGRVMRSTAHILPPKQHTRRFALERIELGINYLKKYLVKVDLKHKKVIFRFDNNAETVMPFDLKKNTS